MSEDAEIWNAIKEEGRQKRWDNRDKSLAILKERGIPIEELDEGSAHYRVDGWSFWPTTGKFYNPKTGERGRGVFNLIKRIKS